MAAMNIITRPPLPFFSPVTLLATWFGSGLIPKAPGTMGSLAALPFAWALLAFCGPWELAVASVAVFAVGIWASGRYADALGRSDPGEVVIDEVAGQWIALIPAPLLADKLWLAFAAGFVLFRLFDIIKPWPISWAERRFSGAWGIMIDDVIAGVFAAIGVWGLGVYLGG